MKLRCKGRGIRELKGVVISGSLYMTFDPGERLLCSKNHGQMMGTKGKLLIVDENETDESD